MQEGHGINAVKSSGIKKKLRKIRKSKWVGAVALNEDFWEAFLNENFINMCCSCWYQLSRQWSWSKAGPSRLSCTQSSSSQIFFQGLSWCLALQRCSGEEIRLGKCCAWLGPTGISWERMYPVGKVTKFGGWKVPKKENCVHLLALAICVSSCTLHISLDFELLWYVLFLACGFECDHWKPETC